MPYDLKPLSCNPAALNGLSEKLIISHWENNDSGAVKLLKTIEQTATEAAFAHKGA
jgi:superoxide dismutase, Fe-Mn family